MLIPPQIRPADPRFGSGPSKVPAAALSRLAQTPNLMGTSHRHRPVRDLVGRVKEGLAALFRPPSGYELIMGVGGTTVCWDAMIFSIMERTSAHGVFGAFGAKFAQAVAAAPHLAEPVINEGLPGTLSLPPATAGVDCYAWPQNETSTGVIAPVRRPQGNPQALTLIDATSAAGGVEVDLAECDLYYFAPQKVLASEGGLWLSYCSPAAVERIERIAGSQRWIPNSLSLAQALENTRKNQTLNTPAIATLYLMAEQLDWLNEQGGLSFASGRCRESARHLYQWADASEFAHSFAAKEVRSPLVGTIEFTGVSAAKIAAILRENQIVDTEPYRGVGSNQLRIAMYPSIDPADVAALTQCIDWIVSQLAR